MIEKVSLKIKQTISEYRRDRNIGIYIWLIFSHVTETLSSNQTEPSGKMYQCEIAQFNSSTFVNGGTLRSIVDSHQHSAMLKCQ